MKRISAAIVVIALFLFLMRAWRSLPGSTFFALRNPQSQNRIRIQIGGEPATLDPAKASDQYAFAILRNVLEGLFKLDPEGRLQNALCSSYEISPDGLNYKFKLNPDAKWSDGKPVTVDQFIAAIRRTVDPKTASPNAEFFLAIANAKDVYAGRAHPEALAVTSDSRGELLIRLERPDPIFLLELTLPAAAPIRAEQFTSEGIWNPVSPVTGDYEISEYRPSERIELTPNPLRVQPGELNVTYRILNEEITAMNLFESGRIEIISMVSPDEIEAWQKKAWLRKVSSTTIFYLSFNLKKPPLSERDWRVAIAASVDREGLARALHGSFEPVTSYLPPILEGALPYRTFKEDAAIAALKSRIRAQGDKPRLHLAYGSSAFTKIVAEKLQADLDRELGLKVELEPMELKTLLGRLRSDPPEMFFLGMSATFGDPTNQLNAFSASSAPNFSRYENADYEKSLAEFKVTPIGERRAETARALNRKLTETDVAVIPVLLRMQVYAVQKDVRGFQLNPFQVIQLNALRK